MADSVTKWKSGQNPSPGTPSVGYPNCIFAWNTGRGTSFAAQTSDPIAYPSEVFSFAINTNGATISSSTTLTYHVYGGQNTTGPWKQLLTGTISNASIDEETELVNVNAETYGMGVVGKGIFEYYTIKLTPNQDPGTFSITVGVNAQSLNKG